MRLENLLTKIRNVKNKVRTASKIAVTGLILTTSALGVTQTARGNDPNYLPADFNKDGIVDIRDLFDFSNEWLKEIEDKNIIPVCECGLLDNPKELYVLQNDIDAQGNCFTLLDGVRFDMDNHNLKGDETGIGIIVGSNSTVKNGKINNFEIGLEIDGNNNDLSRITSDNNNYQGIVLWGNRNRLSSINTNLNFHQGIWIHGKNNQIIGSNLSDVESSSSSNIFTNCKYDRELGNLTRKWSYHPIAKNKFGVPIANTLITAYNQNGDLELAVKTEANGKTPKVSLTSYIIKNFEINNFLPYTTRAEKGRLTLTHTYTPTDPNQEDIFVLD